jgi:hypothetical protein
LYDGNLTYDSYGNFFFVELHGLGPSRRSQEEPGRARKSQEKRGKAFQAPLIKEGLMLIEQKRNCHMIVSFLLDCMGWVLQLSQGSLIMPLESLALKQMRKSHIVIMGRAFFSLV